MRSSPLDELLKFLEEDISSELEAENLTSWLLNAGNRDLGTALQEFSQDELEAMKEEILDGTRATLSIDISDTLLEYLETLTSESEEEDKDDDEYESDDDDDSSDNEDEDDDDY